MPQIFVYFENNKNLSLTMCEVINIEGSKSLNSHHDLSSTVNPDSMKVLILIGTLLLVILSIASCTIKYLGKVAVYSFVTELLSLNP